MDNTEIPTTQAAHSARATDETGMRARKHLRCSSPLLGLALLAAGCGSGSGTTGLDTGGGAHAALATAADCVDMRDRIHAEAARKIEIQAASLRRGGWNSYGIAEDIRAISLVEGSEAPGGGSPGDGALDSGGSGPDSFTETNVQEAGVDEADFIETDGRNIYLLHGNEFVTATAWPPEQSALGSRTPIEGTPHSMFVADRRAVVFSQVYDEDGSLGSSDDCYGFGPADMIPTAEAMRFGDFAPCFSTFTKVTVLDLDGGPSVVREIYLEGSYTAARRHDAMVRVVVTGGFGRPQNIPDFWQTSLAARAPRSEEQFFADVEEWKTAALEAISETALEDWLPAQWERSDSGLQPIPPSCSAAHFPDTGLTDHGLTRIFGFDMQTENGELHDTLVLGNASQVYASADTLVLAQPDWSWWARGDKNDRSSVHLFSAGADSPASAYLGSGFIPGVPLDQFAFDMEGGVLRIAATRTSVDDTFGGPTSTASFVVTASLQGGDLQVLGSTGAMAPDERIFATRFLGDKGYVVTFRQVDPLFVVDLSDPAMPTVLGELKIPGFSEYVHPLGEDHLLTIGRDADLTGRARGLSLKIFDVADPASPLLAHDHTFTRQGWSDANNDHKAFIFDSATGLLTFPFYSWEGTPLSALELFSADPSAGIAPLAEVVHTDLTVNPCLELWGGDCPSAPQMRRGLFIGDYLYSISQGGIRVHPLDNPALTVATVELPAAATDHGGPVAVDF